jgi:hypothetical protein
MLTQRMHECSVMDMLKSMNAQLTGLTAKMERIEVIETEVKNLRVLMTDLKNENKKLKAEALDNERKFAELNEKNISLENRLNSLEQHHRSWSARILNVPLTRRTIRRFVILSTTSLYSLSSRVQCLKTFFVSYQLRNSSLRSVTFCLASLGSRSQLSCVSTTATCVMLALE